MAKVVRSNNHVSWELDDNEKQQLDNVITEKAKTADIFSMVAETQNLQKKIYSALGKDGYTDRATRLGLQKDLYAYQNSLKRLKSYRYDVDNDLKNFSELQNLATERSKKYSAFNSEQEYGKYSVGFGNVESETYTNTKTTEGATERKKWYNWNLNRITELEGLIAENKTKMKNGGDAKTLKEENKKYQSEINDLEAENNRYTRLQMTGTDKYISLIDNEDFEEKSSNRNFTNPTEDELYDEDHLNDSSLWEVRSDGKTYDYYGNLVYDPETGTYGDGYGEVNGRIQRTASKTTVTDPLGMYSSADKDKVGTALGDNAITGGGSYSNIITSGVHKAWDELTDTEVSTYYYILNTEGTEAAEQYLDDMEVELTYRKTKKEQEEVQNANGLELAAYQAANIVGSPIAGAVAGIDDLVSTIKGEDINPYNYAHSLQNKYSTASSAVSSRIDEKVNSNIANYLLQRGYDEDKVNKWLENGGAQILGYTLGEANSWLESALKSFVGAEGLGEVTHLISMGLGSLDNTVKEEWEAGTSDTKTLTLGLIAGAAEVVFEKVSLDHYFGTDDPLTIRNIIKNVLAQGGVEASEEVFTEISNILANTVVLGSRSDYAEYMEEYERQGYSKSKARLYSILKLSKQVLDAGVGGFVSGGLMIGPTSTLGYVGNTQEANQIGSTMRSNGTSTALADTMLAYNDAKSNAGTEISTETNTENTVENSTENAAEETAESTAESTAENAVENTAENAADGTAQDITQDTTQDTAEEAQKKSKKKKSKQSISDKDMVKLANKIKAGTATDADIGRLSMGMQEVSVDSKTASSMVRSLIEGGMDDVMALSMVYSSIGVDGEINTDDYKDIIDKAAARINEATTAAANADIQPLDVTDENATETAADGSNSITLEAVSQKYGNQAQAVENTYKIGGGKQDIAHFDDAYRAVYNLGDAGVPYSYVENLLDDTANLSGTDADIARTISYLTKEQIEIAYQTGKDAAEAKAQAQDKANKDARNGKTGRKKGNVTGIGVTGNDLQKAFNMNNSQARAYNLLATFAEATGIDIVLYKSELNSETGKYTGAQGKFKWDNDTIYIDINAGLLNEGDANYLIKYTMLRTFSHEFTHFIEKWNPIQYNEFRKLVFARLTATGENVNDLINKKLDMDTSGKMTYSEASRETVAQAMADILPDTTFINELATKHKTIFQKLIERLKDFAKQLKDYFNSLVSNSAREANALKEQVGDAVHYVEDIVKMYDSIALEAVENYQAANAVEEAVEEDKFTGKATDNRVTASNNGYTVTDNREYGSIEIKFDEKPSETIRNVLKANKFRWYGKKGIWYGKATHEAIAEALDKAYEAERATEKPVKGPKEIDTDKLFGAVRDAAEISDKTSEEVDVKLSDYEKTDETGTINSYDAAKEYATGKGYRLEFNKLSAKKKIIQIDIFDKQGLPVGNPIIIGELGQEPHPSNWNKVKETIDQREAEITEGATQEEAPKSDFMKSWEQATQEERDEVIEAIQENSKISHVAPTEIRNEVPEPQTNEATAEVEEIKEDASNGKNADNQGAVLQSEPDGAGASRLLDELQTENVQGTGERREAVEPRQEEGGLSGRNSDRESSGSGDSGRERTGKSRDIRRDDVLTPEENQAEAETQAKSQAEQGDEQTPVTRVEKEAKEEELKETVTEQIEQKSTEQPKGSNFVIDDDIGLPQGEKTRFNANLDAIRLIKELDAEGRNATAAEQEILSKYVGWGGLSNAFGELKWNRETHENEMVAKSGWEKEFAAMRQLVTDSIITQQEYEAMSASTRNAHYTSVEVIKAMYDGLKQLGFTGGRMLEPSSGVGNFVGAMPTDMSRSVKSWTMVELDRITGQIAKYLYPHADVRIQGFENANIPNGYMDVAIGNVPFGNYGVVDRTYPKRITKAIHNYFFAKSLDKVRTGGIVMFITSSFTMNGKDTAIRQYIMDRADLLGAIRLPNTAFADSAGTGVVTDILVLKKRAEGTEYSGEAFLEAPYRLVGDNWRNQQNVNINEYFDNHPEMVLGTADIVRGMYGANSLTYKPLENVGTLGEQIRKAFQNITGKMDYRVQTTPEKANFAVERASKKTKNGGLVVKEDGKAYRNEGGNLTEVTSDKNTVARIAGILGIRDAYRKLVNYMQQGLVKKEITKARKDLNAAYDNFVAKYGFINSPKNKGAMAGDPDRYSILSLEKYDAKEKTATKADIFTKDTIRPNRTINHVDDIGAGVIISINRKGGIDAAFIASLTGKTEEDVTRELVNSRMAFKTRDGGLEAPEKYLSGNVRAKLRDAEALVHFDKDYQNNIDELKKVIPKDIPFNDIYVAIGTQWVPNNVYADFIAEMLGGRNSVNSYSGPDVTVGRTNTGDFKIVVNNSRLKSHYQNTQKWGTSRKSFLDIMQSLMSSTSIKVNDYFEDENGSRKAVVNKVETAAAQAKAEEISKEFQEWLWRDENRRNELSKLYNGTYNALATPKYNGKNLTINGLNADFTLKDHQLNAVQRVISSGGNTLLAHRVGAGKTLEMASAAMKLRELGIVQKPMFVVPKSLVAQWGKEFMNYFPTARLLVSDEKSFTKDNRKVFTNSIANNDYDAIILSYEQFEKIPMSKDYLADFYQQQINEILAAIAEEKAESNGKGITVKEMEKRKAQLQKKLAELTTKSKDENNVDFEQLGIDSLFVDEAHNFKNLQYITRMSNVSGLSNSSGSQRAFDLYTKIRYLQGLNGGRGIVFATATPVMNSMAEMYIMQKYLQSDTLEQLGLKSFDAWAKQFGEVVNAVEIKPSGQGFRVKQSFSNFRNLNELQLLFRSFSDVVTEVPDLKIPKMKGGKVNIVVCEPGQFQKDYMKELEKRAENVKNVDPSVDNMLKITSDGRKVAYTQRMIDPSLPYEPGCKIFRCCDNVLTEYKQSNKIKGTQLIFCDMATPKGRSSTSKNLSEDADTDTIDTGSASLYDDMRNYLVKRGIPAKEIAFIHEADTDAKKSQLFDDVNDGKVRVLIGSTGKMGVGMNAQKRVVAIHHLDAPWRPGDVEQRDGRAFRQKNMNEEVSKYTYVTEGSFDARLWDILDRKQHFINQIMNGEDVGRSAEDTGNVTLSAAEVKALASGNPMIMEQVELTNEITKLQDLKKAYNSSIAAAKIKQFEDEQRIVTLADSIENGKLDIKTRDANYSADNFFMTIGNKQYTDKKEAGAALATAVLSKAKNGEFVTIGKFAGFELKIIKQQAEYIGSIVGANNYRFNFYSESTTRMISHIIGVVEDIDSKIKKWTADLAEAKTDLAAQENIIATPFAKQEELNQKTARYNEVMTILNPKEEQALDSIDDGTVQEQSRDYLDDVELSRTQFDERSNFDAQNTYTSGNDINSPVSQAISSAKTSIKQIPALFKDKHVHFEGINIDIGGGRFDLATDYLAKQGVRNYLFDPYNRAEDINRSTLGFLQSGNKADTATCANVLNVIAEPGARANVILEAAKAIKSSGTAYFMVYEGDGSGIGRATSAGWQNNLKTEGYVKEIEQYFGDVVRKGKLIIATEPQSSLPKALWEISPGNAIQYQQREKSLSDREVLEIAADEVNVSSLTDGEKDALTIFQKRLERLHELEDQRAEQGRLYREQQFRKNTDRNEAAKTLNRMRVLDSQIQAANDAVLSVEEKSVLRRVLQRAREVVESKEREHSQEMLRRIRDRRNNATAIKKYKARIRTDVNDLTNWVLHPNNKDIVKHIPDALKSSVIPFLSSINFMSKRSLQGGNATIADEEFLKRLSSLKSALKENINVSGLYSGYNDLPPDFMDELQTFIDAVQGIVSNNSGEFVINRMTAAELQELSKVVKALKGYITQLNRFHANAMYQHVYEAGDNTINALAEMKDASKHTGAVSNYLLWQQMRPAYAFERFGEGGKAIFDGLRRGQATLAFNTKAIESFVKKTYTEAEVKAWEKDTKTFQLGGDTVKIPLAKIMSLYELSKRPQALGHILGEGVRVATYLHNGKKISDVGHTLTMEEVNKITGSLSARQKNVADKLQQFMAKKGGEWGNYVSVKRWGEAMFGEETYFPINSDGRHLEATADEQPSAASLYTLLNMSFTKELKENANNRIILYSIFDVFTNHMASMAQYNAFALPILDALKWFNYKQVEVDEEGNKTVSSSVRDQMTRAFGAPEEKSPGSGVRGYAETFVTNILKAFNGTEAQGSPYDSFGLKVLHGYNRAQIAFNTRVVVQQPLAITRAAMILDYDSIVRGLKLSPAEIKKNIAEMQKYSGIAAWKALGFYDVNISRGLTNIIKQNSTVFDKITEIGTKGAELADTLTWAAMWSASKEQIARKQNIKPENSKFFGAVTDLFEEVIYKTQVVDSVLTKNEFLRSKGFLARSIGSFMSEPTTTASMLINAYDKYSMDRQRGMTRQQAWKMNGKTIGRTAFVYGLTAVMLAVVTAVADAWRDDDDYESFWDKWLEAFGGNLIDELMPLNKLPWFSQFYEMLKEAISVGGFDVYGQMGNYVWTDMAEQIVKGAEIIRDNALGEGNGYTWYGGIYKLLQAASGITGLPMAAATREVVNAWNNIVGAMAPSLKVKTYDAGTKSSLKSALSSGYMTESEVIDELVKTGEAEDENDAYWTVKEWSTGENAYGEILDAVRNGGDFKAAMSELTAHGYTEKQVLSRVKSSISEWYANGEITKAQASNMMTKYLGMDGDDVTEQVSEWSAKVETGIAYSDIKEQYINGTISKEEAITMRVKYGGENRGDAEETVTSWQCEKDTGIAYDDIKDSFMDGDITEAQAKNMYIKYGGLTEAQATEKTAVLSFVKKYPACDGISYAAVENYNTYCSGVPVETFWDAWKYNSSASADVDANGKAISGSKKAKVLAYINTLNLTYSQKDSLYNAFGWKQSTIDEAPWH